MSESLGSKTVTPAISAHLAADLIADGEQMPVYVWTIDHPAGRVLVDTDMKNGEAQGSPSWLRNRG